MSRCLGSTAMGSHPPVHPHLGGHDGVTVALPSGGQPCGHAPCSALRTSWGGLGRIEARRPGPPSCWEARLPWEQLAQHVAVDGGQLPGGGSLATSGGGCECRALGGAPLLHRPPAAKAQATPLFCRPRGGPESAPGKPQTILPDTHKAGTEKQASRPAQPGPADLGRAVRPPSQLHQPAPQPCKPPRSSHPPIPLSLSGASVPHPLTCPLTLTVLLHQPPCRLTAAAPRLSRPCSGLAPHVHEPWGCLSWQDQPTGTAHPLGPKLNSSPPL